MKHAAVNRLSYRDALIQIRKQERTTQNRSVTTPPDQAQTIDTSTTKQSRSTVNKDIQCNMDTDSSAVVDVGGASADQASSVTAHATTCTSKTSSRGDSDVITHSDLYQLGLLAVLIQVSDDRSISRSTIIKTILNHVFKMIDKPHDDIRQAISQYYSPAQTGSTEDPADDHENRKINPKSKSKSEVKNTKGTKKGTRLHHVHNNTMECKRDSCPPTGIKTFPVSASGIARYYMCPRILVKYKKHKV